MSNLPVFANQYVSYADDIRLHVRPDGAFIGGPFSAPLSINHRIAQALMRRGNFLPSKFLNKTGSSVARHMDGKHRVKDIVRLVLDEYDGQEESALLIYNFIEGESQSGVAHFHSEPRNTNFRITGSPTDYYPNAMALEVTHRCNCRCRHCYLSAGGDNSKARELSPKSLVQILETMFKNGLMCCEITGGESLMYPGLWDVLECILRHKALSSILTNGMLVTEEIATRINEYKPAILQVSLDGPTAEVHDAFRRAPGCFDAATRAIKLFEQNTDAIVRVAMSVWPGNLHLIEETMDLARSLGATWFACQPVTSNGRGLEDGGSLSLGSNEFAVYEEILRKCACRSGPDTLGLVLPKGGGQKLEPLYKNCGVAHKDVTVSPTGDVRPCTMAPSSLSFGNLATTPYEEVFSRNKRFARLPNTGGEECDECPARMVCRPCVIKGVEAYSRMRVKGFDSCQWGKRHQVADILEELGWDMRGFSGEGCHNDVCGSGIAL